MVLLIVKDFEELVVAHEDKISLGELVAFSHQLARAGHILKVENKIDCLQLGYESPTVIDLFKRFFSFLYGKRLVLSKVQKALYSDPKPLPKVAKEPTPITIVIKPHGKVLKYYN